MPTWRSVCGVMPLAEWKKQGRYLHLDSFFFSGVCTMMLPQPGCNCTWCKMCRFNDRAVVAPAYVERLHSVAGPTVDDFARAKFDETQARIRDVKQIVYAWTIHTSAFVTHSYWDTKLSEAVPND